MNNAKLAEVVDFAAPASTWVSVGLARQITGFALSTDVTSPANVVTVQLRKATSAAGANAANLGTAVSGDLKAAYTMLDEDLGAFTDGTPYTFVQAVVTDVDSPNAVQGGVVLSERRFDPA